MIPDIAAKSGIFASDIPILNGSKRANEHFSGTFWQRDSGGHAPVGATAVWSCGNGSGARRDGRAAAADARAGKGEAAV